jgi:hypothetical protein
MVWQVGNRGIGEAQGTGGGRDRGTAPATDTSLASALDLGRRRKWQRIIVRSLLAQVPARCRYLTVR